MAGFHNIFTENIAKLLIHQTCKDAVKRIRALHELIKLYPAAIAGFE